MVQFIIEINDAEEKVLLTNMISIQEWLDNAIHSKARRLIDKIVERETDRQPNKISFEEKCMIVMNTELESGAEVNARHLAEFLRE